MGVKDRCMENFFRCPKKVVLKIGGEHLGRQSKDFASERQNRERVSKSIVVSSLTYLGTSLAKGEEVKHTPTSTGLLTSGLDKAPPWGELTTGLSMLS